MTVERLVRTLASLAPVEGGEAPADLDRALAFLSSDLDASEVVKASYGVAVVTVAVAVLALVVPDVGGVLASAVVAAGASGAYALRSGPLWLADARRSRALGAAPDLVGLAVLRARVAPTPERTAAFAAEHGRPPLATSLREHARRSFGTPRAGWEGFARTWEEWDPAFARAVSLLGAALSAPPADRDRLLDRALATALDGARDRMATFAADVQGPTNALYAFGVVLPLALVAALPAASGAGAAVTLPLIVAVYDVLLPGALLAAGAWLLGRRPVAFPPAPVPADHPDVPDRRARTAVFAALAGGIAWAASSLVLPPWTRWVAVPGCALGAGAVCWFRPVVDVRERVRAMEAGVPDALVCVGHRLGNGDAVEAAVASAGRELSDPAGEAFADAAGVQRRLGVDVREAFLGDHGALADVPSPRTRASAALLALAAREGGQATHVLVEMGGHVDDLIAVEDDARRELASVVGTLRSTACCFAPLIGGSTVALSGVLSAATVEDGLAPLPTAPLGVAVGVYVLLLAALLAGLAAALERGVDRAHVGYHAGWAVLAASALYPIAAAIAGRLVAVQL